MSHYIRALLCLLLLIYAEESIANSRHKKSKSTDNDKTAKKKPEPPLLNVDNLPSLEEIAASIQMEQYLPYFYKMGVVDTRLLVRLGRMDFHIMEMDWPDITKQQVAKLKETVDQLIIQATVTVVNDESPEYSERKKLQFGISL
jgi:hypothetical protein